jgi:hypothetical protein
MRRGNMYQMRPLKTDGVRPLKKRYRLACRTHKVKLLYYRVLELDPHLLGGFKVRLFNLYYNVRLLRLSGSEKSEGRSQKGQVTNPPLT